MALATLSIYWLQFKLDSSRDFRERRVLFDELVAQAEKSYCQNVSGGAPANIKIPLDRAAELETGINTELGALDYLTLASVGASFWPHDRAHNFGMEGLRLAEQHGDPVDIYSANLILGHIDFIEFRETKDEAYLNEARSHFQRAKDYLDNYPRKYQRHYFEGQLYLLWGSHELSVGKIQEGNGAIQMARAAWQELPGRENRLNRISDAVRDIEEGRPPRLPCPSQIAISPPFMEKLSRSEGIAETTKSSPELIELGNEDSKGKEGPIANEIKERVRILEREVQSMLGSFPTLESSRQGKSESAPQSDQTESKCSFTLINNTQFEVWLLINGFDRDDFKLPAESRRRFSMPCGQLSLYRREHKTSVSWDISIFRNPDGSPAEPIIEITSCCMELVNRSGHL